MKHLSQNTTKKGIASFYVVIFTTLLLSVVVVSFTRLIISETSQTSDDDLSQSAYDAALAGIEDAKSALLGCQQNGSSCFDLIAADCDTFVDYAKETLKRATISETDGAIVVQEIEGTSNKEQQAYTCVTINNQVSEYLGALQSSNRTKLIPFTIENDESISSITIKWHSLSQNGNTFTNLSSNQLFGPASKAPNPPVLVAQVIQANYEFSVEDLGSDLHEDDGTGQGTLVLYPKSGDGTTTIDGTALTQSGDEQKVNKPTAVQCSARSTNGYACSTTINLPTPATGQLYLRLSLPYGNQDTNFAVSGINGTGDAIAFKDVQYVVDSTGRANDLYRRIEARVEIGNPYFPIPEYAVQLSGNGDNSGFNKSFYTTINCWQSDNGVASSCPNHGSAL